MGAELAELSPGSNETIGRAWSGSRMSSRSTSVQAEQRPSPALLFFANPCSFAFLVSDLESSQRARASVSHSNPARFARPIPSVDSNSMATRAASLESADRSGRARVGPYHGETLTLSVAAIWPFARLLDDYSEELSMLRDAGVDIATLGSFDGRLSHALVRNLVERSLQRTGNPALGLHAGELTEPEDFGVLGLVVRHCANLRESARSFQRYLHIFDENSEVDLVEDGGRATWRIRSVFARTLPVANDFQVSATLAVWIRAFGITTSPLEIHLNHCASTNMAEYQRVFRCPVRLGAPHNAIVFPRDWLDTPALAANGALCSVFSLQADRLRAAHARNESVSARVHRLLVEHLASGDIGVPRIARRLRMSPATLRRRLAEEATTFTELVENLRLELALEYVTDRGIPISEVAALLGFANQSAFGKAFKRWLGCSPLEYRFSTRA